ncbi:MAG: type II toxin-antitoxin system VapC family toxin, partial [Candidatus Aenigmarchaeota archaeon]|nr:type II toxin-antitoxin system VapC family toxin [Candidatus Aenigmarchaeota archaeon]
ALDSDILIYALRGKEPFVSTVKELEKKVALATTDINVFELYAGAYKSSHSDRELASVKGALNALTLLHTSEGSMELAGKIAADLHRKRTPIDAKDLFIASICMVSGCSLLTRNTKHFERIDGLRLFDPS